jgi:DNA-binding NtrC family response regulator
MGKIAYIEHMSDVSDLAQPTIDTHKTILVIGRSSATADQVRELIEFMDTPSVVTSAVSNWRKNLGEQRLEALFVAPELDDAQITSLLDEVSEIDPNVPIVMMQSAPR